LLPVYVSPLLTHDPFSLDNILITLRGGGEREGVAKGGGERRRERGEGEEGRSERKEGGSVNDNVLEY
jgi:hypothetical protein